MTKNKTVLSAFVFAAAALCIFSAATLFGISAFEECVGIVIGVAMMIVALLCHNISKLFRSVPRKSKLPYFISFLLNTVACGFSASAYYTVLEINAGVGELFAAALIAALLLAVCAAVYCFVSAHTVLCIVFCLLDIALGAFAVYGWVTAENAFFSFLFFSCIVAFFYIFAIKTAAKKYMRAPLVQTVSLHSFGIFILITFVVLIVLSEGDALDGFDGSEFGSGGGKKKKVKTKSSSYGRSTSAAAAALEMVDVGMEAAEEKKKKKKNNKVN